MADITQADHTFIPPTHYTNNSTFVVVGTPDDVRTYLSGTVYIDHAPIEDAIVNDPAIFYRIQTNNDNSEGGEVWRTIAEISATIVASTMETLDDTGAASGQAVVPVAATADLAIGDSVYIMDDGGAAASEWAEVGAISAGVSFTVLDDLKYTYASGEDVFILGVFRAAFHIADLSGVAHLRVICINGDTTGHNWASAAYAKYGTDIE